MYSVVENGKYFSASHCHIEGPVIIYLFMTKGGGGGKSTEEGFVNTCEIKH